MSQKLAFFGVGELAQPYLDALGRREDVRLTAVCDPDPRRAETVAANWGARVFPHFEPMLREAGADALFVCVPARLQGEILDKAAEQRLPFFVEPPGAADFTQARRLATSIKESGLVTGVGFTGRFIDVIREAKEYLGVNVIPLALGWWLSGHSSSDGKDTEAGPAYSLLWNEACRLIDLLRYFRGEVAEVACAQDKEVLTVLLRQTAGTSATLACAAYPIAEPRIELELLGEGWYLRFLDGLTTLRLGEREKTTIIHQANNPHAEQLAAFLKAVTAKKPALAGCTYADGYQAMRVCQAAVDAARNRAWVKMEDVP